MPTIYHRRRRGQRRKMSPISRSDWQHYENWTDEEERASKRADRGRAGSSTRPHSHRQQQQQQQLAPRPREWPTFRPASGALAPCGGRGGPANFLITPDPLPLGRHRRRSGAMGAGCQNELTGRLPLLLGKQWPRPSSPSWCRSSWRASGCSCSPG